MPERNQGVRVETDRDGVWLAVRLPERVLLDASLRVHARGWSGPYRLGVLVREFVARLADLPPGRPAERTRGAARAQARLALLRLDAQATPKPQPRRRTGQKNSA